MSISFHIVTLGCPKNLVDSESMAFLLKEDGFSMVESPYEADVIIVNTCAFILDAQEESIEAILTMAKVKEETGAVLIVTGCMPQRFKEELAVEIPEVDSWMGLEKIGAISDVAKNTLEGNKVRKFKNPPPTKYETLPRIFSTYPYGYLKISEGCSHSCSFCVIPKIRGKYRSRSVEEILKEAKDMVKSGIKELILIAQDTTAYGIDVYGKKMLPYLIQSLCNLEGVEWIRLMYAYPTSVDEALLKVIAKEEKVCKYIDIPLQHSHPAVLKKMGRPFKEEFTKGVVEKIRDIIPNVAIRTTLIVGHPGETPKRYEHLLKFVQDMKFYHLGVFTYSEEKGTVSSQYRKPSKKEALRRKEMVMKLQREISHKLRSNLVGKVVRSVVDQKVDGGGVVLDLEGGNVKDVSTLPQGTVAVGRTEFDAPEIDGSLFIVENTPCNTFTKVEILKSTEYDLIGCPAK